MSPISDGAPSGRLRVLVIHSFYSADQPSGENVSVASEVGALRRAGHEVKLVAAHTDELRGMPGYSVRAALRVSTGRGTSPIDQIRSFQPDIVHIQNLFPNFGRKWVAKVPYPIVVTLRNFRMVCANGTLFRDGEVCNCVPTVSLGLGLNIVVTEIPDWRRCPLPWPPGREPCQIQF